MVELTVVYDPQFSLPTMKRIAGFLPFLMTASFAFDQSPNGLKLDDVKVVLVQDKQPEHGKEVDITVRMNPCPEIQEDLADRQERFERHVRLLLRGTERGAAQAHVQFLPET